MTAHNPKHYVVEVHIGNDVLCKSHEEETTAFRQYDRLVESGHTARIWYDRRLIASNY